MVDKGEEIRSRGFVGLDRDYLFEVKQHGFSDVQLANLTGTSEDDIRTLRIKLGLEPAYKLVDTCAAEFESYTPYYYSTYEQEDEVQADRPQEDHDSGRRSQPDRPGHRV